MTNYAVDLESLHFHAPPADSIPAIVPDFFAWVSALGGSHLGYFSLHGDRLDDDSVEDGSRVASSFVGFLSTSNGSRIGWWRPSGEPLAAAPVVLLESEGEFRVYGRSAEQFFLRWSKFLIDGAYDLVPSEEEERAELAEGIAKLSAWLATRGVHELGDSDELNRLSTSIETWFATWSAQRCALAQEDPARKTFAEALKGQIGLPPAEKRHQRTLADVIVTATQCQAFGTLVAQKPLAISPEFEAAVRAFREQDAEELPEAGLWYRATFELNSAGVFSIRRHYLAEPNGDERKLDDEGLRQDFARMPRTPYWTPSWLRARL